MSNLSIYIDIESSKSSKIVKNKTFYSKKKFTLKENSSRANSLNILSINDVNITIKLENKQYKKKVKKRNVVKKLYIIIIRILYYFISIKFIF